MAERMKGHKHVLVSPATHRRLLHEAARRGRKVYSLADELLSKALDGLRAQPYPPLPEPRIWGGRGRRKGDLDQPLGAVTNEQDPHTPIVPQTEQFVMEPTGR